MVRIIKIKSFKKTVLLPDTTPPIDNIHQFSKIAVTFDIVTRSTNHLKRNKDAKSILPFAPYYLLSSPQFSLKGCLGTTQS